MADLDRLAAEAEHDGIRRLVVGAVVRHDCRLPLLRRRADDFLGGLLELPSGKVDPGEPLRSALVREIREETGLDIDAPDARDYLGNFDYTFASGTPTRQFTLAAQVTEPGPVEFREHDTYPLGIPRRRPPGERGRPKRTAHLPDPAEGIVGCGRHDLDAHRQDQL